MTLGRNDPCHCGSGKKYKKCHHDADQTRMRPVAEPRSELHDLDDRLTEALFSWLVKQYNDEMAEIAKNLATFPFIDEKFLIKWIFYVADIDGRRGIDLFLESAGATLPSRVRSWAEVQRKAHVSIWEVLDLEPARRMALRDVFTGEQRSVHEVAASQSLKPGMLVLARVAEASPEPVIAGMHPMPLFPRDAAVVIETVRKMLRRRTKVAPERLRDPLIAWTMLDAWTVELDRLSRPPDLRDSEGNEIALTTDRWSFDPARRDEVIERLAMIEGAKEDGATFVIVRHRGGEERPIALLVIEDATLLCDTLTKERADEIRDEINAATADLLTPGERTTTDPRIEMQKGLPAADREYDPEIARAELELKEEYYARWLDEPVPALDGKTPRQAARTKRGREQLRLLLNDLELREEARAESERFDVDTLREALGLL